MTDYTAAPSLTGYVYLPSSPRVLSHSRFYRRHLACIFKISLLKILSTIGDHDKRFTLLAFIFLSIPIYYPLSGSNISLRSFIQIELDINVFNQKGS